MDLAAFQHLIDDPVDGGKWLAGFGIADTRTAHRNLISLTTSGAPPEMLLAVFKQLGPMLRWTADPDRVLNNLERYFQAIDEPKAFLQSVLDDGTILVPLLEIFSTSQYLSDLLIQEPGLFLMVRKTEGRPLARQVLTEELVSDLNRCDKDADVLLAIRRFKHRQMLRIAYGDIIRRQSLEIVTQQISYVADAAVEGALRVAGQRLFAKRGTPRTASGEPARFTVLALGKLGGRELNYSSDIDLMFLFDAEGATDQNPIDNAQYFAELGREIVRLLSEQTDQGFAYRVDMRLRPNGQHGPLALSVVDALRYYDTRGRTWERQAFIKARPIAGNIWLGEEFLAQLQPWIYRRYLGLADISGIQSLKRKIERSAESSRSGIHNVKTGPGGIRDIEFSIQFLQLLNGGALPVVRTGNTLDAIEKLDATGCLSHQESEILAESYKFLRKIEHRLQIMFDLQTHHFTEDRGELRKLALRMGYSDKPKQTVLEQFEHDFLEKTDLNRRILNHLLHHAFRGGEDAAAEVDLILDPKPDPDMIREVLGKYGFEDIPGAYRLLSDLAEERTPFSSARRCRHFLASIAPQLLDAISGTPRPDTTLTMLASVSDSLGGKGTLWELFSFNPPSLGLYVRLCAYAPFLTDILRRDPGMLDGLMDSLVLDRIPRRHVMQWVLHHLVRGAEQPEPILNAFKNDMVLHIGTRDLLGKEDIRETTGALSDVAQACLSQIALSEFEELVRKHGYPMRLYTRTSPETGGLEEISFPGRFAIVGLGKFGGREMNYHSDLDLLFLYDGAGHTAPIGLDTANRTFQPAAPDSVEMIDTQTFYNTLAQRIVKRTSQFGPWGKLYEVDLRLRPLGNKGSLSVSLESLEHFFRSGGGELWQRQSLCKARLVFAIDRYYALPLEMSELFDFPDAKKTMTQLVNHSLRRSLFAKAWQPEMAVSIREMRRRLEEANPNDRLKRGPGGIVDVEFIVQMLQLKHGAARAAIRAQNTLDALEKLETAAILKPEECRTLRRHYRFLRSIESALRLMNMPSTSRLPEEPADLEKLAQMIHILSGDALVALVDQATREIGELFEHTFQKNGP